MGTEIEDVFVANLAPVGSLQETVNMYELLNAKDAEIARLRAILAPIIKHADRHDYAPPYMINVQQCREIRESINVTD